MGDPSSIGGSSNAWQNYTQGQGWSVTPEPNQNNQQTSATSGDETTAHASNFKDTTVKPNTAAGQPSATIGGSNNLVQLTVTNPDGTTSTKTGTLQVTLTNSRKENSQIQNNPAAAKGHAAHYKADHSVLKSQGNVSTSTVFTPYENGAPGKPVDLSQTMPAAVVPVSGQPYVVAENPMILLIGVLLAANQLGTNLTLAATTYLNNVQKIQKETTAMTNYLQAQVAGLNVNNTSDSTQIAKIQLPTGGLTPLQQGILEHAVGPTTYASLQKDTQGGVASVPYATVNQILQDLENSNSQLSNTSNMVSQRMLGPLQTSTTNSQKQISSTLAAGQQVQASLIQNIAS